jgi:hypothetical protein
MHDLLCVGKGGLRVLESDLELGLLGGDTGELSLESKRIILDAREGFLVCGLDNTSTVYRTYRAPADLRSAR